MAVIALLLSFLVAPQTLDRAALAPIVEPVLAETETPGVVVAVVRGDELLLLEPFGLRDLASASPMRADDLFQIGSCTKTFTAALLVLASAKGELGLDDPVGQWLDEGRTLPDWVHDVTLRQLASHTSGVPRDASNRRNVPDSPSVMEPYSTAELYEGLATMRLAGAGRWSYSNFGFGLLGHALERAAGKRYDELLRERILAPLGMSDTGIQPSAAQEQRLASGYWPGDPERLARPRWRFGEVCGFGGIFSSGRDLARYASALLATDETAFFPAEARATLFTPVADVDPAGNRRMSVGWFVDRVAGVGETVGHGGEVDSFSATISLLREARIGLVVLANRGGDSAERVSTAVLTKGLRGR